MESVGSFRFVNELKLNSSLPGLIGRHGAGVPGAWPGLAWRYSRGPGMARLNGWWKGWPKGRCRRGPSDYGADEVGENGGISNNREEFSTEPFAFLSLFNAVNRGGIIS